MKTSKLLSVVTAIAVALLVLTASVAAPILCRPFYYAHISFLHLDTVFSFPEEEIRQAFDEMMNFCIGLRSDFSCGLLPFSESGRDHFVDVKFLFQLDLLLLAVSLLVLLVLQRVRKYKKWTPAPLLSHGPGFWGAVGLMVVFVVVALLVASDFTRAFVVFHTLFFPGKSNWLFDWQTDPIILLLPEVFFRNCAILIFALILFWCAVLIVTDLLLQRRRKQRGEALS